MSDGRRSIRGGGRRRLAGTGGRGADGGRDGGRIPRGRLTCEEDGDGRPAGRRSRTSKKLGDTDAVHTNCANAHRHTTVPFRVLHNGHGRVLCCSRLCEREKCLIRLVFSLFLGLMIFFYCFVCIFWVLCDNCSGLSYVKFLFIIWDLSLFFDLIFDLSVLWLI